MKRLVVMFFVLATWGALFAQDSLKSLIQELYTNDYNTGAIVVVHQDKEIYDLFTQKQEVEKVEQKGYRVQVFSSNRGAKARQRAYEIKDDILKKDATVDVYVTYTAPWWKVRIGNCKTEEQAKQLREWVGKNFPEYLTETYVVPSTILVEK